MKLYNKTGMRTLNDTGAAEALGLTRAELNRIARHLGNVGEQHGRGVLYNSADLDRICEHLGRPVAPERFTLEAAPARKPQPAKFDTASGRQRALFAGLDCLAGQKDLFATDGEL